MTAALETQALGRRYGSQWALRDCTLEVPRGSVTALVGPNGAGKTTLLRLAVGLTRPSAGSVRVLGWTRTRTPPRHCRASVSSRRSIRSTAASPSRRCSASVVRSTRAGTTSAARGRIAELELPLKKKVRSLSGGQRAQVALTLALAKRPELLLLDEPVASLDPLARREFMQSVLEAVAEREMAVVLSSHILADLERVCDHLVILATGRTQLVGSVEEIVASHRLLTGPRDGAEDVARVNEVVRETHAERQTTLLVRANGHVYDSRWTVHELDLEEIVLAYLGQDAARRREAVAS